MATNITQSERDKNWEEYKRRSASRKKTVKMDWGDKPISKTTRELAEQAQREASAPASVHMPAVNKNADILDYVNSSASVENMSLADIKRAAFKAQEEKNGPKHATELSKADTASKLSSLGKNERNMKMAAISSFRAQKEAERAPTPVERGAYALDSMWKKGTGAALILAQGTADSIHDSIENAGNEEYQKAKRRREVLENRLADSTIGINQDEGILAPGGEAVTTQDIIRAGIENAKEQEERHKIQTVIDDDSPGMKLYESGIKSEKKAMEGLSDTAKQVFGIGLSIADNALTLPTAMINPSLPLAIMSVKAAGGKAYDLSKQGASAKEAILRGAVSGGIEALTEKIPLDNIIDAVKIGGKPFVKSVLKQMGTEATEESISYILNYIADKAAQDPYAEFSLSELVMSAVGGAASGGIMASGAAALGNISNAMRNSSGQTLQAGENNGIIETNNAQEGNYVREEINGQREEATGRYGENARLHGGKKEVRNIPGNDGRGEKGSGTNRKTLNSLLRPGERRRRASLGQEANREDVRAYIIDAADNSVELSEQEVALEYGVPSFVIKAENYPAEKKSPAFTRNGQIYFKEGLDAELKGAYGIHEIAHAMKQTEFEPYLEIVDKTQMNLNTESPFINGLLKQLGQHTGIDIKKAIEEQNVKSIIDFYDELNAAIYGTWYIADTDTRSNIETVFLNTGTHIKELEDIYEQFKNRNTQDTYVQAETVLVMPAVGSAADGIMASGAAALGNISNAMRNSSGQTLQADENNGIIETNNAQEGNYVREEESVDRSFKGISQGTGGNVAGGKSEGKETPGRVGEEISEARKRQPGRLRDASAKEVSGILIENRKTPQPGSAAEHAQRKAAEYNKEVIVTDDSLWEEAFGGNGQEPEPARSHGGKIYIKEGIDKDYVSLAVDHEMTHVMKQVKFTPYIDFLKDMRERMNFSEKDTLFFADIILEHLQIKDSDGKYRPMEISDLENAVYESRFYDEICSTAYGHYANGEILGETADGKTVDFRRVFKDFDSYAAQLSDIHRQFKESQNNAVNTETAAEHAESNINPSGSKQKPKTKTVSRAERYIKKQEKAFFEKVSKIFGQEMPVGYTDDIISNIKARMQDGRYISREDTEILFKETADLMRQAYIDNTESVSKPESFQIGDKVSPTDRNNMGTIVGLPNEENGDKYTVYFYNTQKGTEAEVEFSYEQLNPYMSKTESLGVDELNDAGRSNYENDLYEFSKALDKFSTEYAEAREYIANDTTPEETNGKIAEFKTLYENIRRLEKKEKAAERKASLKQDEKNIVEGLLKGTQKFEDIPPKYNINGILEVYDAKKAVAENRKGIKEFNKHRKFELRAMAADHLDELWKWKDKPAGFLYKRETMERIFRDIIPDKDVAESMIADYITPVHKNTANVNRLKNTTRKTIKELNLSDKKNHYVKYMNGNDAVAEAVSERTLVQLLGEGKINDADVTKSGADLQKIKNAVNVFRSVYNGLIDQMDDVLMRNGYKPVEYRKDYFPHFEADKPDTLFQKAAARIGMKIKSDKLPTNIAGLTHTFRPGKPHFGHAMQRTGVRTEYDAVKGFDSYIESIADVIYHTDDIQKLRALENEIRYETSEESVREEIDKIMRDSSLDMVSQQTALDEVYRRDKTHLSNLAVQLREYTDNLANKKSIDDRTIEHMVGRGFYDGVKQLESRFSANMVGLNIRANLTNFIPISQAISNLNTSDVIRSMAISMKNLFKDDGFTDKSTFLTNREGSDILSKTALQKGVDNASKLLSWIDTFTSNVIVRAKYMENLRGGMDEGSAMDNADDFAASVIADRSKGALPTIFNSKNPFIKAFTAFQVEVNNQVSYYTKDIPRLSKEEKKKYLWGMTKTAVASYLINLLFDWMFGDTPAFDPIGLALDFAEDVRDEDQTTYEAILNLGDAVIEDVPFVGSWFGGGRVPFASALPEKDKLKTIFNPKTPENKRKELALKETGKVLTNIVMPAGGAQLRKTAEGLTSYAQKGSYTYNNKGEKIMRFPVEQNAGNAVRSALFGQYATKEGKEYVDGGFEKFTADKTEKIERIEEENNIDRAESVRVLKELSDIKREEDKRQYIYDLPWTKDDKQKLHGMIFDSKTSIDYSNENSFKITNAFESDDKRKNAENAVRLGVNVDKVIEFFDEQKDIKGIKFQGKTVKNSRRKAVERICERYAKNEEQFITLMRLAGFPTYDGELYSLRKVPS